MGQDSVTTVVRDGEGILMRGNTGLGMTSLRACWLKTLSAAPGDASRVIVIEDTPEIHAGRSRGGVARNVLCALSLACALATAACGATTQSQYPVGIGTGPNSLKGSPCACLELPNEALDPTYLMPKV